jgi:hypothetical protein
MRVLYILSCIILLFSCKEKCDYPVYFEVSIVRPGTKIWLDLDSGKVEEFYEIENGHNVDRKNRTKLLTYCSANELITVKCKMNDYDTVFVVNNREVKGCFLGIIKRRNRMDVTHDYYEGGLGDFRLDY